MPTRTSIVISLLALASVLAFASAAPTARADSPKPLTCEGRCERQNANCIKNARTGRDRVDCQFEQHACIAKCGDKP